MKAPFRLPPARHPLARKLAIVTVLKLLGLMAIWWAFFSGPHAGAGEGMSAEQAAEAILHPQIQQYRFSNTTK